MIDLNNYDQKISRITAAFSAMNKLLTKSLNTGIIISAKNL